MKLTTIKQNNKMKKGKRNRGRAWLAGVLALSMLMSTTAAFGLNEVEVEQPLPENNEEVFAADNSVNFADEKTSEQSINQADKTTANTVEIPAELNVPNESGELPQRALKMHLGSRAVTVVAGGEIFSKNIETMPMLRNNRTLVPLRFICEEVLDCEVEYVPSNKTVILTRKDLKAVVDLNSSVVEANYSDGRSEYPQMDQPPVLKDNYTYMPLRFFSELFGCKVGYSLDKTITVLNYFNPENDVVVADRPVAQVTFEEYTVGQPTFKYTDSSYDKNKLEITDRQWRFTIGGKTYTDADAANLVNKITQSGDYTLYYRVKNSDNIWSEFTPFVLNVKANQAPVITGLTAVRSDNVRSSVVNSGEKIDFAYNIENEEWEKIVDEEWEYSWTSNGFDKHMLGKPTVLYATNSPYAVTLKVKDAAGNWGSATTYISPKSTVAVAEAYSKFTNLIPGEVFINLKKTNFNNAKSVEPQNLEFQDVTLLASNNPETVPTTCILEQDKIAGDARLRFHHKNNTGNSVRFYAVAKNETGHPITLTVGQNAAAGPSTGVIQVGVSVVERYMTQSYKTVTKVLQPGEIYLINQNAPVVKQGNTVAGLIDVSSADPVTYTICCMNVGSSYQNYHYLMPAEKNSTHIRGTFAQASMSMDYTFSGNEVEKIVLGREDAFEGYFRTGVDALTGEDVIHKGNRGVVHKMTVTAKKKVGLLFNPRGTAYYGLIMIDGKIINLSAAGMMAGIAEGCTVDVMEAGETKEITYIVPSGSDSPVLLVAIPESEWNNY